MTSANLKNIEAIKRLRAMLSGDAKCDISLIYNTLRECEVNTDPVWETKGRKSENGVAVITDFICGIEHNGHFERFVERHQGRIGVSHKELSRLCHDFLGLTPKEVIMEIMMARAEELVLRNNMTIKEISLYFGYPDTSNFIKIFKQKFGVTPRAYKMDRGV